MNKERAFRISFHICEEAEEDSDYGRVSGSSRALNQLEQLQLHSMQKLLDINQSSSSEEDNKEGCAIYCRYLTLSADG